MRASKFNNIGIFPISFHDKERITCPIYFDLKRVSNTAFILFILLLLLQNTNVSSPLFVHKSGAFLVAKTAVLGYSVTGVEALLLVPMRVVPVPSFGILSLPLPVTELIRVNKSVQKQSGLQPSWEYTLVVSSFFIAEKNTISKSVVRM